MKFILRLGTKCSPDGTAVINRSMKHLLFSVRSGVSVNNRKSFAGLGEGGGGGGAVVSRRFGSNERRTNVKAACGAGRAPGDDGNDISLHRGRYVNAGHK